ncbi:MAG: hypothetical protein AB8B83_05345 [Bdellovibrionales bacterium]
MSIELKRRQVLVGGASLVAFPGVALGNQSSDLGDFTAHEESDVDLASADAPPEAASFDYKGLAALASAAAAGQTVFLPAVEPKNVTSPEEPVGWVLKPGINYIE